MKKWAYEVFLKFDKASSLPTMDNLAENWDRGTKQLALDRAWRIGLMRCS